MAHHTTPDAPLDRLAWRVAEFTRLTGISRCTLWRMTRRGDIKLTHVGTVPMVPRAEAIRLGLIAD
jgi:hypothetical protein